MRWRCVKLEEEFLCLRFVCWLVESRRIGPDTASGYFSEVQGWHLRFQGVRLASGMRLERMRELLRGLRRTVYEYTRTVAGVCAEAWRHSCCAARWICCSVREC